MPKKAFNRIQHPFMIKALEKAGIQGTHVNLIKAIYSKLTANIKLNEDSTEIRNKMRLSTLSISIQYSF